MKAARHYEFVHGNESEVAKITSLKAGSTERKRELERLRLKGNFHHNLDVLAGKPGELIVLRRPTAEEDKKPKEFLACPFCLGFVLHHALWRHVRVCPFKDNKNGTDDEDEKYRRIQTKGRLLLLDAKCPERTTKLKTVVSAMRNDDITEVVTADTLIMDYGSSLCEKLGTAKAHDISQRMRQLARLLTELRTLPASRLPRCSLEEYLRPERFDDVVAAVKSLCSFEDKSGESRFGIPSLALKLGHSLKKCVYIIWGKAVRSKNKDREEDAVNMEKLFEREWGDRISHHSLTTLSRRKFNTTQVLPLTTDLKKLRDHLDNNMRKCSPELLRKPTTADWKSFAETTLNRVVLFNKRRSGEASRLLVSEYQQRPEWQAKSKDEVFKSLDASEKELCKRY